MDSIKGTIDRIEDDFIVIRTENNQEILWPKNKIKKSFQEGDAVTVFLSPDKEGTEDNKTLAKNILNQILNSQ